MQCCGVLALVPCLARSAAAVPAAATPMTIRVVLRRWPCFFAGALFSPGAAGAFVWICCGWLALAGLGAGAFV